MTLGTNKTIPPCTTRPSPVSKPEPYGDASHIADLYTGTAQLESARSMHKCTESREINNKQTTPTRVLLPRPHPPDTPPPHSHISVLRRIGMTLEPTPHAPRYTLRRYGQSQDQDPHTSIPATGAWVAHETQVALSCSCRNEHLGPAPRIDLCQLQLTTGIVGTGTGTFRPAHAHYVRGTAPDTYWHGPDTSMYLHEGKPSLETLAPPQSSPSDQ